MDSAITVHEWLFKHHGCSESLLSDLARDSEYWEKCEKFVDDNGHNSVRVLSPKQFSWLECIRDGLLENE